MTPVSQQEPLRISFVAAGDNLIHEPIYSYHEGFDYSDLYASVRPLIETADVAYVNQESICGGEELGLSGRFPRFNSPSGILDALAASGFDWVGTANNHTLDFGAEGVLSQLARIEELGLTQSGTAASPSAAQQPTVILVQGVRIGLANYTLSTNGIVGPPGSEYLVATLTPRSSGLQFEDGADQASFLAPPLSPASTLRLLTDLRQLEAVSDLQIVSMHWGEEGDHMPNAQQRALARLLADNGVDAIIGSHPHVVQPLEFIATAQGAQVPVAWSLGNFLSAQQQPEELRGALAHWTFVYDPQTGETKIEDARLVAIHTRISADDHGYFVSPG
jgi:poly-gamma-glutamate synthesis protein (capsule biosynthesis protein)